MNYSANKSKNCTVMVYPANSYMGYMICKEMAHESGHYNQNKKECKEILAICCGEGGMYDKLKEMGKPVKVIVLKDASRMDEWKKELKDRKCDAMMLSMSGIPHHHNKMMGVARQEDAKEEMKMFTKSMEHAMEMCQNMHCKAMVISTAFCADDSKFKFWHHMYKAVEKAAEKHFKGECAMMMHNMFFEALYLNKEEIMRENTLSWPVSEDAKACPLAMRDFARCCMMEMCKMMKHENKMMSHKMKKHHITGRDKLTPREMMEMLDASLNMDVEYNEVDRKEWKKMAEEEKMLSPMQIHLCTEAFEMMEKGCMKKCSDECKKLTGHQPMPFEEWMDEHRDKFEGH